MFQSFGRRTNRGLSSSQRALLSGGLAELDALNALATVGRWQDVCLEVGFGTGEHLIAKALKAPESLLIGCEPFLNGVVQTITKIKQHDLRNVRIFADDVRLLLPKLPDSLLSQAFILFPDPWPKRKQAKRRLVSQMLIDGLYAKLKPGGTILIATDSEGYANGVLELFNQHLGFTWLNEGQHTVEPAGWEATKYYFNAKRVGSVIYFLSFRKD